MRTAVIQSFMNTNDRYCREYVVESAGRGVACRTAEGEWQVILHSASAANSGASGQYSPAGTGQDQLIDGYVHQVMQGDALTAEAEKAAISKKWRP